MKLNEKTVLVGKRVFLVPYLSKHVETYHEWMKSPDLLELTASEPLSLEEEHAMQKSWHEDEDKLTFIVLARSAPSSSEVDDDSEEALRAELASAPMAGDVNIFLHEPEEEGGVGDAECEVMIAASEWRRKGLAREALTLLLRYATSASPVGLALSSSSNLMVKITTTNEPSIALFKSLGFGEVGRSEVWNEVELRYGAGEGGSSSEGDWRTIKLQSFVIDREVA